ncbi:protein translocase subunit SecDF [Porphyromonas circumdentaria]|uniref:protein translocase subunit SecDF n=1 Tax=Porphyromonas circumdentaria TaxID=29524 RepID=UPI0026DC0D69|nr:protein translocase subunit SecDF [Porphyromonas circumdentaria]MDO4722464.1 protein translocase subunit SecDF [Porphyromonas circumdentaria]
MQNKGFVIFITAALAIICAYYLSFTPVVRHYENKAEAMTAAGQDGKAYLDSMANEKVWFGQTLKKARTQQIGLGLDLKGGMNVVLRLNAKDLLINLSDHSEDPNFLKALDNATKSSQSGDFIDKFVSEYKKIAPDGQLSIIFGNGDLREQVSARSTNEEVIKILKEKYNSASEASINVLRTRIDRFGVVAPNIQKIEGEGRILVELPGVKEPERVRSLLQQSANLQFWRTYDYTEIESDLINANTRLSAMASLSTTEVTPSEEVTAEVTPAEETAPATEETAAVAPEATEVTADTVESKAEATNDVLFSRLNLINRGAIVGMARNADRAAIDSLIQIAKEKGFIREDLLLLWGNTPYVNPETKRETDLYELYAIRGNRTGQPDLGGEVVTSSKSEMSQSMISRGPIVTMAMNEEGARKWARLTKENIGKPIAVVLDNVVYSAPAPRGEITGGRSEISGDFTVEQTVDLANVLNSGRMEATVTIEQENVVGPTLGEESIRSGVISFFVALLILMIYMCLAYGLIPGLIANGALVINSFFTLGILASFHSVLTLSGIAGLVLTLGMAVDANVLIFERIKEELRAGKSVTRAIADGYGNAFSAIFDSNITTIITGVILYTFGTGPIRGFATTLIIGLIASFITTVFLTRIVAEWLDKKGKMSKVTYTTSITRNILTNPTFNILGKRKLGIAIPVILVLVGVVGFATLGLNKGIEFSGGRNFVIAFDQKVNIEEIRATLAPELDNKLVVTSIGNEGTEVRVATNYMIEENTAEVEDAINDKLYNACKAFYQNPVSKETFLSESIVSSQKVSASMSKDISRKAFIAVLISLFFMAFYILIRFRRISYSIGAFASVTATTLSIIALYILLWKFMPFTMEIDQNFIAAILAIIGYSINDTVVVFDRIRETVKNYPNRDFYTTINDALNSTLSRTLNTSLTTFIVMFIIFIFGGASMRSFTFAILLGIVIGTYSTLFVASPIAYMLATKKSKKQIAKR